MFAHDNPIPALLSYVCQYKEEEGGTAMAWATLATCCGVTTS